MRNELIHWNKTIFGHAKFKIKEIEDKICKIQELPPTRENIDLEAACIWNEMSGWKGERSNGNKSLANYG